MTTIEVTELPGEYSWSIELNYSELHVQFRWSELSYNGKTIGHWGRFINTETGSVLRLSDSDWRKRALENAVISFRQAEVRDSLNLTASEWWSVTDLTQKDAIKSVFKRAQKGEFMGQASFSSSFYVQDLAGIFSQSFVAMRDIVEELVADGEIGLNGMILISADEYKANLAYAERRTGHRSLSMGDMGNWSCSTCGQFGDEYDDPSSFECTSVEKH